MWVYVALRGQISSDVVNEPLGGKMPCILGSVPLFGFGCTKMTPILLVTIPPVFTHEIKTGLSEGGMIEAPSQGVHQSGEHFLGLGCVGGG